MSLLIALAVLVQDKAAERVWQKIEETLEGAKTLKVTYEVDARIVRSTADVDMSSRSNYSGTLLLKDGNKALFTYRNDKGVSGLSSDGQKVLVRFTSPAKESKTPPSLNKCLTTAFGRAGSRGILPWLRASSPPEEEVDMKGLVKISALKAGPGDSLSYQLALHNLTTLFDVQLWYDPKTFLPVKRSIAVTTGATTSNFTETYTFVLDAPVADAELQLK